MNVCVQGAGLAGQGQVITAGGGQQILQHVVKPGGGTVQARVVSGGAGRGQQTIQVVTAAPGRQPGQGGAPNVTINQGRPGDLAPGHVKIQVPQGASQHQILSQISSALAGAGHGQNVSVAVRTSSGTSPATVLQPAAVVQQQQPQAVAASPQPQQRQQQQPQQQQQMVNLQLNNVSAVNSSVQTPPKTTASVTPGTSTSDT